MAIATFKNPRPNVDLGVAQLVIDETTLSDYYQGLELGRPDVVGSAPSMVAANADMSTRMYFENDFGNLWLRQEWDFRRPLTPGIAYEASGQSLDVYQRRDRHVILTETVIKDAVGDIAVVQRHHQSFVLDQSEGQVALRDPSRKEGARTYMLPEGEPFGPIVRTISLEMCGAFFHGDRNYHTDKQASEALGFADVVVGGKMTMSLIGELLDQRFGDTWKSSGKLLVKFANIVWPNETVSVKGVLQGVSEDDTTRRDIACWVEKDNGVVAVVAVGSLRA